MISKNRKIFNYPVLDGKLDDFKSNYTSKEKPTRNWTGGTVQYDFLNQDNQYFESNFAKDIFDMQTKYFAK